MREREDIGGGGEAVSDTKGEEAGKKLQMESYTPLKKKVGSRFSTLGP